MVDAGTESLEVRVSIGLSGRFPPPVWAKPMTEFRRERILFGAHVRRIELLLENGVSW